MTTSLSVASTALLESLNLGSQHKRLLRLQFPGDDGPQAPLLVNRLEAVEALSRDFEYRVELLSSQAGIALKELMGKLVVVELVREDGSLRHFSGHVFEFRFLRTDGGYCHYEMRLLPWLAYLRLRHDNHLFHHMSVQEQTADILADCIHARWRTRSLGDDAQMTDACQFGESDYNYLHRRWEQRGWYYWYEHNAQGHTLVLCGDSTLCEPIDGSTPNIPWQAQAGAVEDDGIALFSPVRTLSSGKVSTNGFNFKAPDTPQQASIPSDNNQGEVPRMEVYEWAGAYGFASQTEADALVRRRVQVIEAQGKHFEARSNDRNAQPGRWFHLGGHFQDAKDSQYLITEVRHSACNNYESGNKAPPEYSNSFHCLRKKIPWRPAPGHNSQPSHIYGLQTATVVGPPGEEIHTDEYGRIRVQFHWDRVGQLDHRSSAWVRVANPWAGSNFGCIALPRVGQEVIVQFLDGNPDRPLITGSVYNQHQMPPWELPANKTQSGILTRSSPGGAAGRGLKNGMGDANALRFEDKKGQEQLWLHAQKDQLTEVEHDEDKWVGNDRRKTVDGNETNTVHKNRTETVDGNEDITIHQNRKERVDHNENISIGDNRTEDVGQNESISIGANRSVTIGGNKSETVAKAKTETIALAKALSIGLGYQTTVGGTMNTTVGLSQSEQVGISKDVRVGKSLTIHAGDRIEIVCGQSSLVMTSEGKVSINGQEFDFSASGPVQINGKDVDIN